MPVTTTLKSRETDELDRKIIMVLQEDGRASLKEIAQKVGLSVDSVHKRIKELLRKGVMEITTSLDPRKLGFQYSTINKIKLKASSDEEKKAFISFLEKHAHCTDLIELLGSHDFLCTIVAEDNDALVKLSDEIKHKFRDIIDSWESSLIVKDHKFNKYAL
jgi:DNA-binding Lrp family transcriptional regulator